MKKDDELELPGDKKPAFTPTRLAIWIIVGALGAYLVISGLAGVFFKA